MCVAVLAAGCALRPKGPMQGQLAGPGAIANPFAAASLHIHPLTRLDRDEAGRVWIICHIELKDAWGDTTKGIGMLQVQLYRPSGGRASGLGIQETAWDVNLSDLDTNVALYDPATRTYRLPLEGAPEWLSADDEDRDLPRARLRAILTTFGPRGEEVVLEDEFAM